MAEVQTQPIITYQAEDEAIPNTISEKLGVEMVRMLCPKCGRFLFYHAIVIGAVRFKCPNCRKWITIEIMPPADIMEEESPDS